MDVRARGPHSFAGALAARGHAVERGAAEPGPERAGVCRPGEDRDRHLARRSGRPGCRAQYDGACARVRFCRSRCGTRGPLGMAVGRCAGRCESVCNPAAAQNLGAVCSAAVLDAVSHWLVAPRPALGGAPVGRRRRLSRADSHERLFSGRGVRALGTVHRALSRSGAGDQVAVVRRWISRWRHRHRRLDGGAWRGAGELARFARSRGSSLGPWRGRDAGAGRRARPEPLAVLLDELVL